VRRVGISTVRSCGWRPSAITSTICGASNASRRRNDSYLLMPLIPPR
jgi:hypothetical protein